MKLYKIAQALSLDVVLGIIILSFAIGKYYGVTLSWHILTGLAIAIWLIYTVDHLLDAHKIKDTSSTYRHRFHQHNQKPLVALFLFLFCVGVINVYFLPRFIIQSGLLLGLITGLYFLLLQSNFFWAKELCVALIYTFGAFTGPIALSYSSLTFTQWLLVPQVFCLAFANLLLFSWNDKLTDEHDGHNSMVLHWGTQRATSVLKIILTTGILSCMVIPAFQSDVSTLIMQSVILAMFVVLAVIFKFSALFRQRELYRILGDGIFYLPLIYILYAC